jgi:hypothetical protein
VRNLANWFSLIKEKPWDILNTQYIVHDDIWEESGATGQPTIKELEEMLGRKLTKSDFNLSIPLTWIHALNQPQILEIIGKEGIIEGIDEYVKNPMKYFPDTPGNRKWLDLPKNFARYKQKITKVLEELGIDPKTYLEEFDKNAVNFNG